MARVRPLELWPSAQGALCLEPPRAVDTSARRLRSVPTPTARGERALSTALASEVTVQNPLAGWYSIRRAIFLEPPSWGAPLEMAQSSKPRVPGRVGLRA